MNEDTIIIGSLNCQNNKYNRSNNLYNNGFNPSKTLANHIQSFGYDILGTQELTKKLSNKIEANLTDYKLYGKYRYGNNILTKLIPIIKDFNENNAIITKDKVIETRTIKLPWIPTNFRDLKIAVFKHSITPRIATIVIIKNPKMGIICAINTHLDYKIPNIKTKQLQSLKSIIQYYSNKYPIILTGDFNMEINFKPFKFFIKDIKSQGLKRVEINKSTHPNHKNPIDHIFIPEDWIIEEAGIINTPELQKITDHNGIYVKVKTDQL